MNDKVTMLCKNDFTEDAWFRLSIEFEFNREDNIVYIHIIKD